MTAAREGLKGNSKEARAAAAHICDVRPVQTVTVTAPDTEALPRLAVPVAEVALPNKDVNALLDEEAALSSFAQAVFSALSAVLPAAPKGYAVGIYVVGEPRASIVVRRTPEKRLERYTGSLSSATGWALRVQTSSGTWKPLP
jgi:hypothetical protein